jgi:hypothetical protein
MEERERETTIFNADLIVPWEMKDLIFINRFSLIKIFHLPRFRSDHAVILLCLEIPTQWNKKIRK